MKVFLGKIIHGINNNNGNNKKTATYNVSFPHSESVSFSTPKVLNVHFPTFLLSALMTSTALAGHEHGAEGPSARSGRGASLALMGTACPEVFVILSGIELGFLVLHQEAADVFPVLVDALR